MTGTLFVVGTPIGNLEDLTFRALRTLKEADVIAAEDTRRTSKLLAHYEIRKRLISVREHNETREIPRLVDRLQRGLSIALVTDAGTPGIADPGARVVAAVREAGLRVVPIPGPSAVATALSASGFAASEFVFMGFPPRSGAARAEWFDRAAGDSRVLVLFESPHRAIRTLDELTNKLSNRIIIAFRELTKLNEQLVMMPNQAIRADVGELTVVVGPSKTGDSAIIDSSQVNRFMCQMIDIAGIDTELAMTAAASIFKTTPQAVRKAVKKHRIWVNQQNESKP